MLLACPKCGSKNLRYAHLRGTGEHLWSWLGIRPLRCRACYCRFIERTWRFSSVRFARCPRCWRQDLSRWSTEDYHVPFFRGLMLNLGANPYRCEYCRTNFISFRRRKERYNPQKRKAQRRHVKPGSEPEPDSGEAGQSEQTGS